MANPVPSIVENIKDVIETMRYYVQRDGGDLRYVGFSEGVVTIQILGACVGCALTDVTYKSGVETILKNEVPEVVKVVVVEGDSQGKAPFIPK